MPVAELACYLVAPSFNGRTAASGAAYRGSNPWGAAKIFPFCALLMPDSTPVQVQELVQDSAPERATQPPVWLTITLICLIYVPVSLTLIPSHHSGSPKPGLMPFELFIGISYEILIATVLFCGLYLRTEPLPNFDISSWLHSQGLAKDIRIGIVISVLYIGVVALLVFFLGPFYRSDAAGPDPVPHETVEIVCFLVLMVMGAIVEEFLFRGYFFQLFYNWTGGLERALVLQAAAFSVAHGLHQTPVGVIDKVLFGLLMGWLANRRQSLVPGIIAHAFGNVAAVILGIALSH
jgi:membrane protease YdiL (CAAX protease family)